MRIATWNVNSILAHEDQVLDWIEAERPDVLCLQETKVVDQAFPEDGFGDLGYDVAFFGQPRYNGVAIASRAEMKDVFRGFAGAADTDDRRLIGATIDDIQIISVYVPNGQTLDSPQYPHKLAWLAELGALIEPTMRAGAPLVVAGDFNVAPTDEDVWDIEAFRGATHVSEPERTAFEKLLDLGLTDALRHFQGADKRVYTFWDYQARAFERDRGMRIDHMLISPSILERATACVVDRAARAEDKRSDHAPVVLDLAH
ncbi:MAG: exodeoxyribonuclease III [Deltaproteobacteria bacterium]|nr:exodeoxyribonuclease III [Deltaproteobacteria bacterium]